jgi:hypothetical protein
MTAFRTTESLAPIDELDNAVAQIMIGNVVGAAFATSYGLVGNGLLATLDEQLTAIKGPARFGRPIAVCLPSDRLAALIDPARIHPSVRDWALDQQGLARAFGSQCMLRVPVRRRVAASLPPHLISYTDGVPYLQSLDPTRIPGGGVFVTALWESGVTVPALTSMNYTGVPEVVTAEAAMRFAQAAGLPSLLPAPLDGRTGTMTVVEAGPSGVFVAREGTFPAAVVRTVVRHAGQPDAQAPSSRSPRATSTGTAPDTSS